MIRDTHAHEKGNKKKKPHRGYAFVVFEREKDMRGNTTIDFPRTVHSGPLDPSALMSLSLGSGPQACLSQPFPPRRPESPPLFFFSI